MKRITFVLALLLLCIPQISGAQTIKVTGTVFGAADKYPLEGAGVMVKGSKNGVATDYNGQYVINVSKDAVLVFSSVGYKSQEIAVNGKTVINVELEEDNEMLETTIVVGYGTAKKISSVVGAATAVKSKVIKDKPVVNVGDALQGQVAGLQVYTSSGDVNANVSMRLRGVNSIYASNSPLFILDGTPVLSSILNSINANDIESVTVLKDASSTAIYGSRAANGVVYITTKKGTGDKPTVRVSGNYSITNMAGNPNTYMNAKELFAFQEIVDPSLATNASWQAFKKFRLENNIHANWKKFMLNENAPSYGGDMVISGRTNKTDYYISMNTNRSSSIEPNNNSLRYGFRTNINTKVTDWFKFGINTSLTYSVHHSAFNPGRNYWQNPINMAYWNRPYDVPWEILTDDSGNFLGYGEAGAYLTDWGGWNPLYFGAVRKTGYNYARINSNLYEEITPIKGLTVRFAQAVEGYDYRSSARNIKDKWGINSTASASESFTRYYRLTSTNTIEYKFNVAEDHSITILGGQEAIVNNQKGFGASSTGQSDIRLQSVAQGTTYGQPSYSLDDYKYNSLFARLSYDYAGKYYVDASFRRDGSSLFGESNRYANFWSLGLMWDAKKESFLKDRNWLNKLQVRASYGTIGNSGIDNYLSLSTVGTGNIYNGGTSLGLSNPGNAALTWEEQRTLSVGIDFGLFDFMEGTLEAYNKRTVNMLMDTPYSYSTGFASGYSNVGEMSNKGIEATLKFNIVQTSNTFFSVSANVSYNKDRIEKLFAGRDEFVLENYGLNLKVGHSYGEFYYVKWAGVDPATGKPLWYDKDGNITDIYRSENSVHIGKSQFAPWAGGLQFDFSWKQFSLQTNFTGVLGKYLINNDALFAMMPAVVGTGGNYWKELLYETWTTPGQKAKYPSPQQEPALAGFDTRFVENASFVRLKNVTLSYSLPKSAINALGGVLTGVRFYVTGRNLLTFTKYKGFDPEVDSNLTLGGYPNTKQYSAGLEITF